MRLKETIDVARRMTLADAGFFQRSLCGFCPSVLVLLLISLVFFMCLCRFWLLSLSSINQRQVARHNRRSPAFCPLAVAAPYISKIPNFEISRSRVSLKLRRQTNSRLKATTELYVTANAKNDATATPALKLGKRNKQTKTPRGDMSHGSPLSKSGSGGAARSAAPPVGARARARAR